MLLAVLLLTAQTQVLARGEQGTVGLLRQLLQFILLPGGNQRLLAVTEDAVDFLPFFAKSLHFRPNELETDQFSRAFEVRYLLSILLQRLIGACIVTRLILGILLETCAARQFWDPTFQSEIFEKV